MSIPLQIIKDRFLSISLRYRLMLYLLLGLAPYILVSLYFFRQSYESRRQQVLLSHMTTAEANAGAVRQFIEGIVEAQEIMEMTMLSQNMTPEQMDSYFRAARTDIPILDNIGFALPSGRIVAGYPQEVIGINVSDRKHFHEVASGIPWTVSNLIRVRPSERLGFIIANRVDKDGKFVGMLSSAISPEVLSRFVTPRISPQVGYSILDGTGRIVVSTVLPSRLIPTNRDRSWIPSVRRALNGQSSFEESFIDRADGVERMGAAVPIEGTKWVLTVYEPVSTAMSSVQQRAIVDISILALLTLLLLILVRVLGDRLARPIRRIAGAASAVARGDFSQRMETRDQSEIGMLSSAFNNMTMGLQRFSSEQQDAREHALFLADVGELLTSSLDLDTILRTVAERTSDFIGDFVTIFELRADKTLSPLAMHSKDPRVIEDINRLLSAEPLKVGGGIAGKAVERNETVFIPDISKLESLEMRYYLQSINAVSTIAAPMRIHGEVAGVLSVSTIGRPMSSNHVPIVEEIARRLGLAMENIRLYEETVEREEFQGALAELAVAVSSTLDPQTVLDAVCSRTLAILRADGVYIWVCQEDEQYLYGAAACGFESEKFIGMTTPLDAEGSGAVQAIDIGKGFVEHHTMKSPRASKRMAEIFHTKAAIFQPLAAAGQTLGAMTIIDIDDPERFDSRALERAEVLSGYASTALSNARAYTRERRIAETLQRSLLPEIPEHAGNFDLAYYYAPAWQEASIGGDFYDYIKVDDTHHGLVVGDVSGKGLQAAVVTAMAKYIVRAYAAEDYNPLPVISRTNQAIEKYTGQDLFITLAYCLFRDDERRVTYSSAGHMPLVIYHRKDGLITHGDPTGPVLGIQQNAFFEEKTITLEPGDILLMYTDGLTDALSPSRERLGEENLDLIVSEIGGRPIREFVSELVNRVRLFSDEKLVDDIVILAAQAR